MTRTRLILAALGLSFVASLVLTPPAAADNCDIFISPEDCQNTGWTIGVIATLAGGVAVATAATTAGTRGGDTDNREPTPPPSPPGPRTISRDRREEDRAAEDIEVRPIADSPSIAIRPIDGMVRGHSIRLQAHHDPGWQTVQEVHRGRD